MPVPLPTQAALINRYLFENPWPLSVLLLVAGGLFVWRGLGTGERRPLLLGGLCAALAAAVLGCAALVTTNAERAASVVQSFVRAAERGATSSMADLLSDGATFHYGKPENPGFGRDEMVAMFRTLEGRYRIEANTVTQLDAESAPGQAATVLLTNRTSVASGAENVPNSWWLRVARQPDDSWKIERIAFLRVAGQTPGSGIWR